MFYKLKVTQIFWSSLYLTGMWSKITGGFALTPNGGVGASSNVTQDVATGIWGGSFLNYFTVRPQKQYGIDGSKFFDIGSMNHELKFGFGYRKTPVASSTTWPGAAEGYMRLRSNAYCAARGITVTSGCFQAALTRARVASYDEKYNDLYIGDTILMGNLTLQAGLRYDIQKTANTPSFAAGNPLLLTPLTLPAISGAVGSCGNPCTATLPDLTFAGDSRQLKWSTVSPRIGLTYALGADKKTLLRASYNRYVSQIGSSVSAANPLGYVSYAYAVGADANGDGIVQRNELLKWQHFYYFDPKNPTAISGTVRVDYGMKTPTTDEFIVGGERELMSDFSVGANFTYRKYNNILGTRAEKTQGAGDYYTRADFVAAGSTSDLPNMSPYVSAGGLYTFNIPGVTYYNTAPGVPTPQFFVITNRPGYSQKYEGLELTATKRLSHNWMLRGNVSFNDWTESCSQATNPDPTPVLGNCPGGQVTQRSAGSGAFGNVFVSSRWSFNMTGLYQLPWDFNVGASVTGRQGYPEPFRITPSNLNANLATSDNVLLEPVGSRRFDNVYEIDLRAAKDFRVFNRFGVTLSADLFNAPNNRTVLQRNTSFDTGTAGRITELQSPRVWRFGAKVSF